ncbi:hypothetical protein BC940DRAFT_306858 [Gongronella butleri]|nr:hypothetical protein BC940DRAFT_306858 [Gongronella butleri]
MPPVVDPAKLDEIKACLLSGMSTRDAARQCGVSMRYIVNKQRRCLLPRRHWGYKKCSESTIKKIQMLSSQGKSLAKVAAACGVSGRTVNKYRLQSPDPDPDRKTIRLSDAKKQEIIKHLLRGVSLTETARLCNSSYESVRILKFINGIQSPGEEMTCDQETIEKIQKQLTAGKRPEDVAWDCDVSCIFVKMIKKQLVIDNLKITHDKTDKATQSVAKGMSVFMAAKMHDITTFRVRKMCKERNIDYTRYINPVTKEEMKRRLEQGESITAVAKACNVSQNSVRNFKKKANSSCSATPRNRLVTENEKQKIERLLRSGLSINQVAFACDRSWPTVARVQRKLQLPRQQIASVANLEKTKQRHFEEVDMPRVSTVTVKPVIKKRNLRAQSVVKEEPVDFPALCAETTPDSIFSSASLENIEFLDEIPFCILI